ncbi:MAG: branched-chain amino acid ABC transporter permease [Reyranellaceae bacterium]
MSARSSAALPARGGGLPGGWWPWLAGLGLALLLTVPLAVPSRYVVYLGTLLAVQASLATSLNLIVGIAGQFALSHAAFYGIGAYASALLIEHGELSFWASLPPALAIAGVMAAAIGWPALRYTGGIHFALITFACGELLRLLCANWDELTGGAQGKRLPYSPEPLLGIDFSSGRGMYLLAAALLLLTLGAVAAMRFSRFGRALLAIREDEVLAASLGIAVTRHKVLAFVASSVLAALAGAVYAPFAGFISPEMMSTGESVAMVGMLIVGGIGTLSGPIVGTLVFFAVPEFLRIAKFYRLVILGAVIVVMVLYMPQGVVGLLAGRRRGRD